MAAGLEGGESRSSNAVRSGRSPRSQTDTYLILNVRLRHEASAKAEGSRGGGGHGHPHGCTRTQSAIYIFTLWASCIKVSGRLSNEA